MEEYKVLFKDIWSILEKFPVKPGEKKDIEWWRKLSDYANQICKDRNYDDLGVHMLCETLDMIEKISVKGATILKNEDSTTKKAS